MEHLLAISISQMHRLWQSVKRTNCTTLFEVSQSLQAASDHFFIVTPRWSSLPIFRGNLEAALDIKSTHDITRQIYYLNY